MESIASTILKYDGYIWGPWVHYKFGCGEEPTTIHCRFVNKNIFAETFTMPHQFLIDLKQNFNVVSVKGREIKVGELTIIIDINGPAEEIKFMDDVDYTCNLIDIRRNGIFLRSQPPSIMYEVSPYDTVVSHIKTKTLVPVNSYWALRNINIMSGWTMQWLYIGKFEATECCICHSDLTEGVRTACKHEYHIGCLTKWLEKSNTCPMCREVV